MNGANWYWLLWLVIGFGLPETIALATGHPERTLSWSVWQLRDLCKLAFYVLWIVLVAWLTGHFFTGKTYKRGKDEQR